MTVSQGGALLPRKSWTRPHPWKGSAQMFNVPPTYCPPLPGPPGGQPGPRGAQWAAQPRGQLVLCLPRLSDTCHVSHKSPEAHGDEAHGEPGPGGPVPGGEGPELVSPATLRPCAGHCPRAPRAPPAAVTAAGALRHAPLGSAAFPADADEGQDAGQCLHELGPACHEPSRPVLRAARPAPFRTTFTPHITLTSPVITGPCG